MFDSDHHHVALPLILSQILGILVVHLDGVLSRINLSCSSY
jgi:hypothetical protein